MKAFLITILFHTAFFYSNIAAQSNAKQDTLNLLTWNIYMRPSIMFWNNQKQRAEHIVKHMQNDSIDVIVFQEVFGKRITKYIKHNLYSKFPYHYGPGKSGLLKLNSGILVLSKYPIVESTLKQYDQCKGGDCRAKKSAVFVSIKKGEKIFQIIGTHLQAEEGFIFQAVRDVQLKTISKFSYIFCNDQFPQIFMGDFNINKDSKHYPEMLQQLEVEDGPILSDLQCTADPDNDLCWAWSPKILDYIFLRKNQSNAKITDRLIMKYTAPLKKKRKDLSDHYAVKAKLIF